MSVAGRFRIENERENGFLKLLTGAAYGELLGVHALGDLSSEFIVAASALIETGVPASMRPRSSSRIRPYPRRCARQFAAPADEGES